MSITPAVSAKEICIKVGAELVLVFINVSDREKGSFMNTVYKAVVRNDGDWWIGWIEEIAGVNCQERSRQELLESLRVTLREALDFNRKEAIAAVGPDYEEELIAV
jgi:hypothetical protein